MASLNEMAISAGVTFLNEIGVDPGIDHMSAMEIIERIRLARDDLRLHHLVERGGGRYGDGHTLPRDVDGDGGSGVVPKREGLGEQRAALLHGKRDA